MTVWIADIARSETCDCVFEDSDYYTVFKCVWEPEAHSDDVSDLGYVTEDS
jgi:hypothetical protein